MARTKEKTKDLPRLRGLKRMETSPRARRVSFDKPSRSIKVELTNGVMFKVPTRLIQILEKATEKDIRDVELLLDGLYLRWPKLDEDLQVQNLLEGTFGTAKWMSGLKEHLAELGRKGGRSRSKAKSTASRLNGAKGGRPRKSHAETARR